MGFLLRVLLLVVLACLIHHSIKIIYITGGLFVQRNNHQPRPCRSIPGIEYGSEDIQTLSNGVALITAGLHDDSPPESRGIYMFDFNQPHKNVTKLTFSGKIQEKDFVPYGFSLWTDKNTGDVTVFVINHGPTYYYNESVEVFHYDETSQLLHHLKTIRDNNFFRLNDIVATSNETFYATNDCTWFQNDWKWPIEIFLQTPLGNVVFYDGQSARRVASGYVLPNGINISSDHRYLYLILYGESKMVILQRHSDDSVTEIKRIDLRMTKANNVELDSNGDLWITGGYKFIPEYEIKPWHPSSMVVQAKENNGEFTFSEVYANDGTDLVDATVASFYNNQILIGTAFSKLMYCDVKSFDLSETAYTAVLGTGH